MCVRVPLKVRYAEALEGEDAMGIRAIVTGVILTCTASLPAHGQISKVFSDPQVRRASHCDQCGVDFGPLWSDNSGCGGTGCGAPCGGCAITPSFTPVGAIHGPRCSCGACGTVLSEVVCTVKHTIDRSLQCVLGAVLPMGVCRGTFDVSSSTICPGGCGGGCADVCDSGFATAGCDSCGTSPYASGHLEPSMSLPPASNPPSVLPTPATPRPAVDPFQDDPAPNGSAFRSQPRQRGSYAYRPSPQKRPQMRRATY